MTEFISRKYGNEGYEVIIKTDCHEHYRASEEFARRLIDHEKPVTDTNAGKWIPVSERLPEKYKSVIAWTRNWELGEAAYDGQTFRWPYDGHRAEVTHWMPMPEPPEEEKQKNQEKAR